MDSIEQILVSQFINKNLVSTFNQSDSDSSISDVERKRLLFWQKVSNFFLETEQITSKYYPEIQKLQTNYRLNDKNWKLEKNFVSELNLSLLLNKQSSFFERFSKGKKIKSIQQVIKYYDEKQIYNRKHQSQFLLAKLYERYNNKTKGFLTLVNLYNSVIENDSKYLYSWLGHFLIYYSDMCSLDIIELFIEIEPDIDKFNSFSDFINKFLLNYTWNLEDAIKIFELLSSLMIDPKHFLNNLNAILKVTKNSSHSFFSEFVNFLLTPEIILKYKVINYLIYNIEFFKSFIISSENKSFLQVFKEYSVKTNNNIILKFIFANWEDFPIYELTKFINSYFPDFNELTDFKDKFKDLLLSIPPNQINFKTFELTFFVLSSVEVSKNFLTNIMEKMESFLERKAFTKNELLDFLSNANLKSLKLFFSNEKIKSLLIQAIKSEINENEQISSQLKMKIAFLTGFTYLITENTIASIMNNLIQDNLGFGISQNEQNNFIEFYNSLISEFKFFCENNQIFIKIEKIREILEILNMCRLPNGSFNADLYFEKFLNYFKENMSFDYFWMISLFGFQQILPNTESFDSNIINKYFNDLNDLVDSSEQSNSFLRNELKQLSIELTKYYANISKKTFKESLEIIDSNSTLLDVIIESICQNLIGNSLFLQKEIGILHCINDLLYSSTNLPIKLYDNSTKVFSKFHYLILFDFLCNIINKYGNLNSNDIHEIIKTKLMILRALGHLSGRSHSKSVIKAISLLKDYQKEFNVINDDCINIINSTPWKYSNLVKDFINQGDFKDNSLFYGIVKGPISSEYSAVKKNLLDIGLSKYLFINNEDEMMDKIVKSITKNEFGRNN